MKKVISLFIVLCLLLSMNVVFADNLIINSTVKYDIDDFSAYLIKHNDGKNTKSLVENYFKDKPNLNKDYAANSDSLTETKIINGKEVKTSKVVKTVKISETQDITFYANGYFGIGELIISKPEKSLEINTFATNTLATVYTTWAQYQYDGYNSVGVWIGAALVGQSFMYDNTNAGITADPTGSYSYNGTLFTHSSDNIWSNFEVGKLIYNLPESYSRIVVKPKLPSTYNICNIYAVVKCNKEGKIYKYGEVIFSD